MLLEWIVYSVLTFILAIGFTSLVGWVIKGVVLRFNGGDRFWASIIAFIGSLLVCYAILAGSGRIGLDLLSISIFIAAILNVVLDLMRVAEEDKAKDA
jgi:hypothetical protein